MYNLPLIFSPDPKNSAYNDFQLQQNQPAWTEFVNHLSQFSELSIPETKDQITLLLEQGGDPEHRALLIAGIGRCLIHLGDFINGAKALGEAYQLVENTDSDSKAFIMSEMGSFLGITAQYDLAILILDKAISLSNQEYLRKTAQYYRSVVLMRKGDLDQLLFLKSSAEYFGQKREYSTLAYHYKNIANGYRRLKDYTSSEVYYEKALSIAEQHDYNHIRSSVLHDNALLSYHMGDSEAAYKLLDKALNHAESDYAKTCIHSTRAVIIKAKGEFEEALKYFQKALVLASEKGVYSMIPSIAYNLSLCNKNLGQFDSAQYMLKVAYDASVELLHQHFPFTGDRKRAVLAYVDDLKTRSTESEVPIKHELSFSLDKSLKDIRGLFQSTALKMLKEYSGKTRQVSEDLQISPRSIFTIQNRTSSYATGDPPEYIAEFVKNNKELNWHELNKKFEEKVFSYLYDQYGQQKKMMSEKLEISYPHFVKMTQDIKL